MQRGRCTDIGPIRDETFEDLLIVKMVTMTQLEIFRGVVFGKSIRSHYAILHVGTEEPEKEYVVVRIHFSSDAPATELRSWCRRSCKLRDLLELKGHWSESDIKERPLL